MLLVGIGSFEVPSTSISFSLEFGPSCFLGIIIEWDENVCNHTNTTSSTTPSCVFKSKVENLALFLLQHLKQNEI
jgi:hypothetical protein